MCAIDREQLARALHEAQEDPYNHPRCFEADDETGRVHVEFCRDAYRRDAAALLSSGVLVDAADVRAQALEDAAAALLRGEGPGSIPGAAVEWLRVRAVSEREGGEG